MSNYQINKTYHTSKPRRIGLLLALTCWSSIVQADMTTDFNRDYFLYKERGGVQAGMAYVKDLNARIEKQVEKRNETTFSKLTRLLNYVLVTGGCFGISKTGPTQKDLADLAPSFNYIDGLAQKEDELNKAVAAIKPEQADPVYQAKGPTLDYSREKVVFSRSHLDEKVDDEKIQTQGRGLLRYIKAAQAKPGVTKIEFAHSSRHDRDDAWRSFTSDNRVIIRDRFDHAFYLIDTPPDGACWAHAMALKESDARVGKDFVAKLLTLNLRERRAVCDYGLDFLAETFVDEYKTLLKEAPDLIQEFENEIKEIIEEMSRDGSFSTHALRSKVLKFIAQKEIFSVLVNRKGKNNQDSRSIVTIKGRNVWQSPGEGWARIWPFVYKYNTLMLNYFKSYSDLPVTDWSTQDYISPDMPWSFAYKGGQDIHFSALHPVGIEREHYREKYATKSYFNAWHKLKGSAQSDAAIRAMIREMDGDMDEKTDNDMQEQINRRDRLG